MSRVLAPAGRRVVDVLPFVVFVVFVGITMLSSPMGDDLQPAFVIGMLVITVGVPLVQWIQSSSDLGFFLLIPTVMSVWQNVYLLPVADEISTAQLSALLPLNFGYALMLAVAMALLGPRARRRSAEAAGDVASRARLIRAMTWCAAILTVYGVLTLGVFGGTFAAALGSWRNLITPFLFLLIGLLAARTTSATGYARYLVVLGAAALAFGFYELYTPNFWQDAGLQDLWRKKGIAIADGTGLPANFYSSENVGDAVARRMAGPFADPVNFGTFLFVAFVAAWWTRSRILAVGFLYGAWLVVSKGALLGVLVWVMVWARYALPRPLFWLTAALAAAVGVVFYLYTVEESSGSTTAHVDGFAAAFEELPRYPLGRGLGRVGVLATVLGNEGTDSGVSESGIGAVIGQLGVVGLGVWIVFAALLIRAGLRLPEVRDRMVVVTLVLGFLLNAMFNEVAMSPNSAAPYFILLGLVLGRGSMQARDAGARPDKIRLASDITIRYNGLQSSRRQKELAPWN